MNRDSLSLPAKAWEQGAYRWFSSPIQVTGLPLLGLEDRETGIILSTTLANPEKRVAAHRAWAAARHSRSSKMAWEILSEMGERGVDPDQKIEATFRGYGHASVGDMARLTIDFAHVPMHLCMALFHEGVINSGQEKSTRYQAAFRHALLQPIHQYVPETFPREELQQVEKEYQELGYMAQAFFVKHQAALHTALAAYFAVDETDAQQRQALQSRVLDCTRSFLLLGQGSGMSFESSARDWSRLIALLKASPRRLYRRIGLQIETLLAPPKDIEAHFYKAEAPSLLRHTQPLDLINQNLRALKQYIETQTDLFKEVSVITEDPMLKAQYVRLLHPDATEGERLLAQYLLLLWPSLEQEQLLQWIHMQPLEKKHALSSLLFSRHSHYQELPSFARTTRLTLALRCCLGRCGILIGTVPGGVFSLCLSFLGQ
ncbi:hypothetical protein [Ktedonobacter robiniae]|uniref:hypothetical protein n=1 Tax=Ktedonobacter robiniae TaxID=2778365 RepID=UPI0019157965|nr:hypothetical protein [Ktedonobacter robiniae]